MGAGVNPLQVIRDHVKPHLKELVEVRDKKLDEVLDLQADIGEVELLAAIARARLRHQERQDEKKLRTEGNHDSTAS